MVLLPNQEKVHKVTIEAAKDILETLKLKDAVVPSTRALESSSLIVSDLTENYFTRRTALQRLMKEGIVEKKGHRYFISNLNRADEFLSYPID